MKLPLERKTNALKWYISQNNPEKHGFTVNMAQNECIEGPVIDSFWHFSIVKSELP